jgi:hypothetical protein
VADEDEVAGRSALVDDRAQVEAEAVDVVAVVLAASRAAVPALVPADDAVARLLERPSLVDPAPQTEAVAVGQHDGRQLLRPAAAGAALRRRSGRFGRGQVDLDVERHAVVGEHDVLLVRGDVEQLWCLEGHHGGAVPPGAVGDNARRDTGRDTDGRGRDAEHGVPSRGRRHSVTTPEAAEPPRWIRGTRAPIRVTIS